MRIFGVDPGTARVGYGVLDVAPGGEVSHVSSGVVVTPSQNSLETRLLEIHSDIALLIRQFKPDEVAIEDLFFVRNITTGIAVAMARGVIALAAAQHGLPVSSYVPMVVKQAVTGFGRATKSEVQEMVRDLLGLKSKPRPDDAADALAIALCHSQHLDVRWQQQPQRQRRQTARV